MFEKRGSEKKSARKSREKIRKKRAKKMEKEDVERRQQVQPNSGNKFILTEIFHE